MPGQRLLSIRPGGMAVVVAALLAASMAGVSVAVAAPSPNSPGKWRLAFSDDFNGTAIDPSKWNNGGKSQNGVNNSPSNVTVSGGNAILNLASSSSGAMLYSGPVDGIGVNRYQLPLGGYAEARMMFPGPTNSTFYNWPAWWSVGNPWPDSGENDIAEVAGWSSPMSMVVGYHGPATDTSAVIPGDLANSWHTYGVRRKATSSDFYYDGKLVKTLATTDPDRPQSLVFNHGLYPGQTAVTGASSQVKVDYVRAWRPDPPRLSSREIHPRSHQLRRRAFIFPPRRLP